MKDQSGIKITHILLILFCLNFTIVSCKLQPTDDANALVNQSADSNNFLDSKLKSNLELWSKSNICSYKIILKASNISPTGFNFPVNMEIQDGKIINVELSSNPKNEKLTRDQIEYIEWQYKTYLTIGQLFDFVNRSTIQKTELIQEEKPNALRLEISYDSQYGYPKKIIYSRNDVTDSYLDFEITKFEMLKSGNSCY